MAKLEKCTIEIMDGYHDLYEELRERDWLNQSGLAYLKSLWRPFGGPTSFVLQTESLGLRYLEYQFTCGIISHPRELQRVGRVDEVVILQFSEESYHVRVTEITGPVTRNEPKQRHWALASECCPEIAADGSSTKNKKEYEVVIARMGDKTLNESANQKSADQQLQEVDGLN
ncbi:hypothetical protein GOBAR_AA38771 [Gossypium barbadense]|uniref:Uncharacterized protein n=1 Tax=Gossypium barbadense TaxID=3634 RepID=A0A2P5VSZ1_GOSBA|nr:hypothetical protein GOBAR_AA38771 [Gossypium barbadense]